MSLQTAIRKFADVPGGLLPLLHEIQAALGFIPKDARGGHRQRHGAFEGGSTRRHQFLPRFSRSAQGPENHPPVPCRGLPGDGFAQARSACQNPPGYRLWRYDPDGRFSLEPVYCLGNCACSPSIRIGDDVYARVDADRFDELLESALSMFKVFIPADTTACALGADAVAAEVALQAQNRGLDVEIIRNGSRGAFWLEPLVEIESDGDRYASGR